MIGLIIGLSIISCWLAFLIGRIHDDIGRIHDDIQILYQRSDKRNKENEIERQHRVKLSKKVVQLEDWKRRLEHKKAKNG